jgi:hypothetical protein
VRAARFGEGHFGASRRGMTMSYFHSPQPDADNLVANLIAYVASAASDATDYYKVTVDATKMLEVRSMTPAGQSGESVNTFDPMVRIYNSAGVLVASDDNSAPDGRNVKVSYKVPKGAGGTYYVQVVSSTATAAPTFGEYILSVKGNSALPPGTPIRAATAPTDAVSAKRLSSGAAGRLLKEAIRQWRLAGFDTSTLKLNVQVADLGGLTLGYVSGNTIYLDDNAAGWGWFVDRTARSDSEFVKSGNQGEQNRIDLLTVLMHEVGHVLGVGHQIDGVMSDTLVAGVRRKAGI